MDKPTTAPGVQVRLRQAGANITYWSRTAPECGVEPGGCPRASQRWVLFGLAGNTAISGMAAIDPAIFKTYSDVHLRVCLVTVAAFQEMTPHRPLLPSPTP